MKTGHRVSGILLHPTSLPGRFGIGDLGPEAHGFVDFLVGARQSLWQVLPLGPTGYGDSPYQCFSAFAGNPLLVSPEALRDHGLLTNEDLAELPELPEDRVDFAAASKLKRALLDQAFDRFEASPDPSLSERFEHFRQAESRWLPDFALFMALKQENELRSWTSWDQSLRQREPKALDEARTRLARAVRSVELAQFLFFHQWAKLRRYAHQSGLQIMGDVPIFVAHDSSDVWAHPDQFDLLEDGHPRVIAGVPPDYFSATGQCWGNPLYRWGVMERRGYDWWVDRFSSVLKLVDLVRLDHFRGFEAYWEIPGQEQTAVNGRWAPGPGTKLFRALTDALGELPVVAENLGVITPEVESLRAEYGFPGMAILQFAFGSDPQGKGFQPHNYEHNAVVYTGTHDNETTVGWYTTEGVGDSTRTAEEVEAERAFCRKYLVSDGTEIHWDFIRAVIASVADTAVVPMQDVLGLGNEARMNLPGRRHGNWMWRMTSEAVTDEIRDRLSELVWTYGRAPRAKTGPTRVASAAP